MYAHFHWLERDYKDHSEEKKQKMNGYNALITHTAYFWFCWKNKRNTNRPPPHPRLYVAKICYRWWIILNDLPVLEDQDRVVVDDGFQPKDSSIEKSAKLQKFPWVGNLWEHLWHIFFGWNNPILTGTTGCGGTSAPGKSKSGGQTSYGTFSIVVIPKNKVTLGHHGIGHSIKMWTYIK